MAGLAYAAFESANIALTDKVNGKDYPSHHLRKERVKKILSPYQDKMDMLWEIRNIDFYGNIKLGSPKREISPEEVREGLNIVGNIIDEIEKILRK